MFEGKVALVTGAGKGIGKEIALELARGGAKCVINYASSAAGAESVAEEIRAMGSEAMTYKCDVSDADAVQKMITDVMEQYGRIDILVNNAGITKDGLMLKMTEADFMAVLDINLKGAFNCMKAVTKPMMKQRYGRIINITSIVGIIGNAGQVNYAAIQGRADWHDKIGGKGTGIKKYYGKRSSTWVHRNRHDGCTAGFRKRTASGTDTDEETGTDGRYRKCGMLPGR